MVSSPATAWEIAGIHGGDLRLMLRLLERRDAKKKQTELDE